MAETTRWAFPEQLQPRPNQFGFDLDAALRSVVLVHAEIPEDAFTAPVLGTERVGSGVVIGNDGLVLTIGYLITEAQTIWLTTIDGTVAPGYPLAYDQTTGFGLVMPLERLAVPALPRGSSSTLATGADVIVIGHGGREHSLTARVIAKREFAGYWEYLLDEAIFAAPAHPQWGGTALVDTAGRLLGIGSLLVQEMERESQLDANMFVPIDLLEPILDDMIRFGRPAGAARPWLGVYTAEAEGHLIVGGVAPGSPAQHAGLRLGDLVIEVAGRRVDSLAAMYRALWSTGTAGVEVPLSIVRGGELMELRIRSADRNECLRKPRHH